MQAKDLRPVDAFAQNFGLKSAIYGLPGSGKSPMCVGTAPNPVLLMCEPGALSMKGMTVPTWPAFTRDKIDEFMLWFGSSAEAKKYDTLVWDSVTQAAEIAVTQELGRFSKAGNQADGRRAYGRMSQWLMEHLNTLYFMPQKHIVLICKQGSDDVQGVQQIRPIMPGKDLNVRLPHLVDQIFHLGVHLNAGVQERTLQCIGDMVTMARDRTGRLAQFEPANIGHVIAKACSA